jgi:GH43 family beta-xylosidase
MALAYTNPVWSGYFADPFVLRCGSEYYAYGTGERLSQTRDGNPAAFEVLRSRDLVKWEALGGALPINEGERDNAFWAPEVAERDGRFYLYYSSAPSGRDELHRVHVAIAENPAGPFSPVGLVLPAAEGFCIDADPFRDPRDGHWYLFFAKDFFAERTGTGLAVVPLAEDMLRAAGPSREVLRANHDWQIYERDRLLYGKRWAAWHTVEGPCVVAHEGRYYCFYSGGNWQTRDYGVSYAMADHPLGPWTHAPGNGPVVLRELAGKVLGPGHNSYTIAPDGRTELLVYHAWNPARTKRQMRLDRLEWTPHGPRCAGPTTGKVSLNT